MEHQERLRDSFEIDLAALNGNMALQMLMDQVALAREEEVSSLAGLSVAGDPAAVEHALRAIASYDFALGLVEWGQARLFHGEDATEAAASGRAAWQRRRRRA